MSKALPKSLGIVLFSFALSAHARDWKKFPAVVEIDTTSDIIAVGDPHSDVERLSGVLTAAGVLSVKGEWSGGTSVVVITGDVLDKGPSALKVLTLIRTLQAQAAAKGGRVVLTMGNHEAEFLADPAAKKSSEFQKELKENGLDPARVGQCEGDWGEFLCNLPAAARVNDWFFSHGGNTGGRTIAELSAAIQGGENLTGDNSILEARLNDKGPNGLPWIYDGHKHTDPQKLLEGYAHKLGVRHIVQGHQPGRIDFLDGQHRNPEDLFQRWGLLFLTDTAMSRGIEGSNSTGGALRISGQRATGICANGSSQVLWDAASKPQMTAIHCGK